MPPATAEMAVVDLFAPFTTDTLLEVRQGKMKPMEGLKIESGIDKQRCDGFVSIGSGGIQGDEHDLTFHGGPDKAVHGCKFMLLISCEDSRSTQ
jgi:MOSC domain-containing protein YiiM